MNSSKALLGILTGIAAGAILGVLFAPGKGADTRKNISRKGKDLANAVNGKIDEKFNQLVNSMTGRKKTKTNNESVTSSKTEMEGSC